MTEDNTTRVIKLSNGESIVCTCIPTRTDEDSDKLHVIHPLKMELKNRVTKKGVVEALTLSRWLQPFTESDEFDIEKSNIVTITSASFALNNYYNFMLESFNEVDANSNEPIVQPRFNNEVSEEQEEQASEEVKEMFNRYISALSGDNKEREMVEDDLSEEEFDSLPCSDTKH
jgi:Ca2+-binding EF-hand superfamily protein